MKLGYLLPLAVFLGLAGAFWFGLDPARDPRHIPSVFIGKPMPELRLAALGQDPGFAAPELAGKVALVNFFASWCVPCTVEHPVLMRIAREGQVTVFGVAYKDKEADALGFLTRLGNPYARQGADPDGRTAIEWGVYGVPETFLIDREGRIRHRVVGPVTPEVYARELAPLIAPLLR